jgi:16S rRNA processing protein RimM
MTGEGYALSLPGNEGSGPGNGSEPSFLAVGKIVGASGLRGAVKARVMTDFPDRFGLLKTVYLGDDLVPYQLRSFELRKNGQQAVLYFEGCDNRDQADLLRGDFIWIPSEDAMPLPEGRYYLHQVLGLQVETEDGDSLGVLSEVLFTGGNDVYIVSDGEREMLIPVLEDVIRELNLTTRKVVVRLPEGLLG